MTKVLIAVISDSHNNTKAIEQVKKYFEKVDMILFLGDGERDLKELTQNFKGEVHAVKGNCDITNNNQNELIIEVLGKRIFMTHGHRYNVKYEYNTIYFKAKECGVDIALFGHSHIGIIERSNDVILMNPGSISHGAMATSRSLGFIDISEKGEIDLYIKELKNNNF